MLIELGELLAVGIAVSFLSFLVWLALKKSKHDRFLNLTLENLKSMTPKDFEYTVAEILRRLGYKDVKVIGRSGDLGVDILAYKDGNNKKVAVQCKKYITKKKVTSPELQLFIGMMVTEYKADYGIYVTTSYYTKDAYHLAMKHKDKLEIWTGRTLAEILLRLQEQQPIKKD
jgi:restriction endonuclease Mrr